MVFLAKPAAKNPALRAFCRRETMAAAASSPFELMPKSEEATRWMASSDLVAEGGLEPTPSGL